MIKDLSNEDKLIEAEKYKEIGNKFFKENKFEEAITEYTKAIDMLPNSLYYSNRAVIYLFIIFLLGMWFKYGKLWRCT
jgi:import receptor subunit TOM70